MIKDYESGNSDYSTSMYNLMKSELSKIEEIVGPEIDNTINNEENLENNTEQNETVNENIDTDGEGELGYIRILDNNIKIRKEEIEMLAA